MKGRFYDSAIIGVFSPLREGKTLFMVWVATLVADKRPIYANFHLKLPFTLIESIDDFEVIPKRACVLLDELYNWLDSRTSSSAVNRFLSSLLLRAGKREWILCYEAKYPHMVDRRLRINTDIFVFAKQVEPNIFRYNIYDITGFTDEFYLDASKLFDLYDTEEEIEPTVQRNYEKLVEKLQDDTIYWRLQSKKAKIEYIATLFKLSKSQALIVYELAENSH